MINNYVSVKLIRKALIKDVLDIKSIINQYAESGVMLSISVFDIYSSLRDFIVYEEDSKILGVCSLKIVWEDLAEIRSLAVNIEKRRKGIGTSLVERAILEALELGVRKVFTLTTSPFFFVKMGFKEIDKSILPHKIWGDCVKCNKFPNCDEIAMLKEVVA